MMRRTDPETPERRTHAMVSRRYAWLVFGFIFIGVLSSP
jgi:hypothetical protein